MNPGMKNINRVEHQRSLASLARKFRNIRLSRKGLGIRLGIRDYGSRAERLGLRDLDLGFRVYLLSCKM